MFKTAYQTDGWYGVLRARAKLTHESTGNIYFTTCVYAQMGDKDKAFEYVEKTFQRREHWMVYIEVDPRFDTIRDDPRFQKMVKRVDLR